MITGAAGALGADLSQAFAREGAERLYLVDRSEAKLRELCAAIGENAIAVRCDLTSVTDMRQAWDGMDLNLGIDVLVTAGGTLGSGKPLLEVDAEEFDQMLSLNVRGTLLAVQLTLTALRQRKGNIVTYGSTAGLAGSRALGAYSTTKGAVSLLTRSLALSLAEEGIRVNSVCPGSITSPMLERNFAAAGADSEMRRQIYKDLHPMKRFGEANEVTEAVLYLASGAASYTTGVALPVDGGRLA
ncbi:SDR family NAD(P)-dependent oxidoreductase [Neorhizobium galegae]|uniref:SDR family NAD(P)-dependent oxidoreductase n=1 Tax=Neorhizobium galegae TaxID=399 RepID=UPI0012FEDCFC|nr:SDR family oxidoreductase [Neorhizobium galegae]